MPISSAVAGSVRGGQTFTWQKANADGSVSPHDLTGATISGTITGIDAPTSTRAIVGSHVVTDGPTGQSQWTYDADDLIEGLYKVKFTATFPSGASPAISFEAVWRVFP